MKQYQKKINQFTSMTKSKKQSIGDISVINNTNSVFGNNTSVDKYRVTEKNKVLKVTLLTI